MAFWTAALTRPFFPSNLFCHPFFVLVLPCRGKVGNGVVGIEKECDILIPAALEKQITVANAHKVLL